MTDPRDGRRVALKKLPNVFQSLVSSKRVFRELKMLCFFKHENVSRLLFSSQLRTSLAVYRESFKVPFSSLHFSLHTCNQQFAFIDHGCVGVAPRYKKIYKTSFSLSYLQARTIPSGLTYWAHTAHTVQRAIIQFSPRSYMCNAQFHDYSFAREFNAEPPTLSMVVKTNLVIM